MKWSAGAHSVSKVLGDLPFWEIRRSRERKWRRESCCPRVPCTVGCCTPRRRGSASHSSCFCAKEVAVNFTEFASHVTSHLSPAIPESVCDAVGVRFDSSRFGRRSEVHPPHIVERAEFARGWAPRRLHQRSHPFDDEDTVSMETSVPGDTEDTGLPIETAEVDPPRAPQLPAAFEAMDRVKVVENCPPPCCCDEECPAIPSRAFQECNEVGSRRGVGQRSGGSDRRERGGRYS